MLCGEQDPRTPPKRHEFIATLIHYATLHIIPNSGHHPTLEQPEIINDALREWLVQPMVLRYRKSVSTLLVIFPDMGFVPEL